ncbi:MAG: DUF3885 domain-containing protein [Clostridia bacterium]|nr:DUF3885 domain-containing protein [Clostridia bacterium]MBO5232362.1 DUF3885 domain-containing protein [Clostridia bacterium]
MTLLNRFYNTLNNFGMQDIEYPIFYSAKIGIRFDIGDSSELEVYSKKHTINPLYIEHCLNKTTQILGSLNPEPDILAILLYYVDENELEKDIKTVLSVANLQPPHEINKKEIIEDDDVCNTALLLWDLSTTNFSKENLLKEIIISDLGGEHLFTASVFWICSDNKIMFHLYDDRGADLVASEKSAIKDTYVKFNKWILDYDREKIEAVFED